MLNLTDDRVRCQDVDSRNIRELHGLVLTGVHRRPLVVDPAQQYSMLGIAFKPGGVRRFQATLGRLRKSRSVGWPGLAWEMGYADQAHLIRDFQEFGSLSPTQYQSLQTSCLAHVPAADALTEEDVKLLRRLQIDPPHERCRR